MAAITRSFSIQYGSLTFANAATGYALEGPISPAFEYRRAAWSFSVVVFGSSASDLETKCTALVNQIRTPRANLIVTMGSRVHSYSEAAKTGWDMEGSIEPEDGSIFNTHVTREYSISIAVQTPATLASDDGVADYSYSHSIGPDGRRRFSVLGTITTDGTTLAEAHYESKIAALITSIKSDIDSTANWTEQEEQRGIERFDFEMTFTRSYIERIFKDSLSADDVAAIKEPQITISPTLIFDANAAPDIPRPIEVTATYSAFIDSTASTDLNAAWTTHVKPLLLNLAEEYSVAQYGNNNLSIVEVAPDFSPTGNAIGGSIRFIIFGSQKLLSVQVEESIISTTGAAKAGVYGTGPYQRLRFPATAAAKAQLISTAIVQGSRKDALAAARAYAKKPEAKAPPGRVLKFHRYKLLSREEASRTGGKGGGWSLDSEEIAYIGPVYSGDPAIPVTTCLLTRVFDYDEDAPLTIPSSGGGGTFSSVARD